MKILTSGIGITKQVAAHWGKRRWLIAFPLSGPKGGYPVLTCYLDDSGKDPQSPITTLAGYVAPDTEWPIFEAHCMSSEHFGHSV
jgi:hypothetical protein